MSLAGYFVRVSELQTHSDGSIRGFNLFRRSSFSNLSISYS